MKKKAKVCHITSVHPRFDSRILKRQCVSLAKNGYDVWFVVNDDGKNEEYKGVHVVTTGHTYSNRFKRMIQGVKSVYSVAININADIYQLHDPELLTVALKLKKHGKKVVFDSHECYARQILTKEYLPKAITRFASFLYYQYETYVAKRIDAVIVPCEGEKRYSFLNRSKKLVYINNYPKKSDVQLNDVCKNERTICYCGSLTYSRGIKHLAMAAKKANVTLMLAGNFTPAEFKDEVMDISPQNIKYYGYLNRQELKEFYSKCSIGMCTLLPIGQYDKMGNLPTKAYEYMGMGLPMIISNFPYNKDFINDNHVGILVNPNDIDEICDSILYLLEHQSEASEMGKLGRKLFETKYNWDVCEKELLQMYAEIIAG